MKPKRSPKLGYLITHGTDTMSWGLSVLRYMLKNLPANVAITGSQVPLSYQFSSSDVYPNVENSIKLLTQLTGPEIFVVFNNGQAAFQDDLWKIDKWSPDAFKGDELARISVDEIIIKGRAYPLNLNRRLDKLILIRTGGTIDSIETEDGLLVPTGNIVTSFISQRFKDFYNEFIPISLMAVDSSDMVLDSWKLIAKAITENCEKEGYTTFFDDNFNPKIQIVSTSPLMTEKDYFDIFSKADGIILNAFGSGTINTKIESGCSPLPALEQAIKEGKIIVIASETPFGTQDFVYQNAWEPIKKGAVPACDFSIAHCQIKLAYILGHRKDIDKIAKKYNISSDVLLKLAFLSGVNFRSFASRKKFEDLIGYQIPTKDPFFNLPFDLGLLQIIRFLNKKEAQEINVNSLESFVDAFNKYFKDINLRNKWSVVLKPDTVIGTNKWGELINSAENFAIITREILDWNIITFELSEINYRELLEKIKTLTENESIGEFLRTFRYVIIEGGRQSLYDAQSFEDISGGLFTKKDYLHLIRSLTVARNKLSSCPALYLCLGHQGFSEMLKEYFIHISTNMNEYVEKIAQYDSLAKNQFISLIERIISAGNNIIIRRGKKELVAQGINNQFFAVKRNELPEIGLKRLKLYKPKKEETNPDFFKAYQKISKLNTGILEDFYSLESLDIVMLHNDDVNEEAILFFNWALDLLAKFNKTYYELLTKDPLLSELANFPIGLEIPSSTLFSIDENDENTLTEIAGLIIYYLNPKTGVVKRDYTLQFHPELFEEIQMFQRRDFESKTLFELTDGIQLLLSCLQAGFIETSKKT